MARPRKSLTDVHYNNYYLYDKNIANVSFLVNQDKYFIASLNRKLKVRFPTAVEFSSDDISRNGRELLHGRFEQ